MPLAPGTWLNHYEILAHIGSGGMGEVYRANDNKLKREVALKVLPEHFARDPERVARFRREAQLLAQLNHPNIALIYNFEEAGETRFLVMELALGDTLRDRVKRGPVPVEESLKIAKQIAEALEHAHDKPIIHRDLKPANIKVTPAGQVKVLDFGLAKAFATARKPVDPADIPTGSQHDTLKGTILGTPAYMSPEQASGRETDKRADIWSFGCVLYELLTGKQAFQGETITEIIASVLKSEPDWSALPKSTPPTVRNMLRRCLQKEAKRRSRDATEIQLQIEETLTASATEAPVAAPMIGRRRAWRWAAVFGLAALVIAAITGIATWRWRSSFSPNSQSIARFSISLPPTEKLGGLSRPAIALSPDGAQLAYVADRAGIQQLYLRAIDSLEAKPVAGTEGATTPSFSPDGQWLVFTTGGFKLKKVSVSGGAPLDLSYASDAYGVSWGPDDGIVFAPLNGSSLSRVSAAGGTTQTITTLDFRKGEFGHRWPEVLPDGKAVLFTVGSGGIWNDAQIVAQSLVTGERKVVVQGGTYPRYVPTGHLLYVRSATLLAVPFDARRLEVTGPAVPILEGVMQSADGAAQFAFSSHGMLAYILGSVQDAESTLVWVDRKGTAEPLAAPPHAYAQPRLSPDGQRVAVDIAGGKDDVWVYDIPRNVLTRLTFEANNARPIWTPDGKRITFRSTKSGPQNLFWKPADGSAPEERLIATEYLAVPHSWSPDAKLLAYYDINPSTGRDIWVLPLEGDRKPRPFLRTPFNETAPVFSPDGRWLAYMSNESGRDEVYVQPYPGPGGKWQISTAGGTEPLWARNGKELFYRNGDKMMAVDIATQPTFSASQPRLLFEGRYVAIAVRTSYDVSLDGQRFLMLKASEQALAATQINVVLNWFEELKRRVPAGR